MSRISRKYVWFFSVCLKRSARTTAAERPQNWRSVGIYERSLDVWRYYGVDGSAPECPSDHSLNLRRRWWCILYGTLRHWTPYISDDVTTVNIDASRRLFHSAPPADDTALLGRPLCAGCVQSTEGSRPGALLVPPRRLLASAALLCMAP